MAAPTAELQPVSRTAPAADEASMGAKTGTKAETRRPAYRLFSSPDVLLAARSQYRSPRLRTGPVRFRTMGVLQPSCASSELRPQPMRLAAACYVRDRGWSAHE